MHAVGGNTVALLHHDLRDWRASVAQSVGVDVSWQQSYERYYASLNPWIKAAPELYVAGRIGCSHQVLGNPGLRKTEFYNDYLAPQDYFYSYGGTLRNDQDGMSYI